MSYLSNFPFIVKEVIDYNLCTRPLFCFVELKFYYRINPKISFFNVGYLFNLNIFVCA